MSTGLRALFGIIGAFAITNNALLLVVIFKNRSMLKTPYNTWVLSLAITDLITGISILVTPVYVIGVESIAVPPGGFGHFFCRMIYSQYLVFTLGIVSVYTVTSMAIDRWMAVARPTKYKTTLTKPRVNVCVLCIWAISVLLNTPHLFEMKAVTDADNKRQCMWVVLTKGTTRKVVAILEFLGKFFLPLLTASLTMVSINRRVRASPALFQSNRGRAGLRLLRMCMLTALVLGVCWFPNQFYYLLFKYDITQLDTPMHHFTVVLCMFNSCINPVIYCISNKSYRKQFLLLLCPRYRDRVIELELTGSDPVSMTNDRINRIHIQPVVSVTKTTHA